MTVAANEKLRALTWQVVRAGILLPRAKIDVHSFLDEKGACFR